MAVENSAMQSLPTPKSVNYIRHLAGFFDRVAEDGRLSSTHVAIYVSIFQMWNANRFQNPLSITRTDLMRISKISSKATYHRCMKELHDYGYFLYEPSHNPLKGSLVSLFCFYSCPQAGKVPGAYVAPGIAQTKKTLNQKNSNISDSNDKDYSEPL